MKHFLQRFSSLLAIALLGVPLAWAVSFTGLTIKTVPQLSFDTRSLQADAASPDVLTRSVGAGAFTLKAMSPYSKGAITYKSSAPGVATVNASTGEVTPVAVGQAVITANQAALAPFPAATARYTLTLSGIQVTYPAWELPARPFSTTEFAITPAPKPTPDHPSPVVYSTETPDLLTVTPDGRITLRKVGKATLVATQAAQGNFAEGKVKATLDVQAAVPTLTWAPVEMRLGGQPLELTAPSSDNPDTGATFSYSVLDDLVTINGNLLTAKRAGTTKITATQKAAGNFTAGSIEVELKVLPAQVSIAFADITQALSADAAKNSFKPAPVVNNLPAGASAPVFEYSSDDTTVATVNGDTINLLKAGTANITAKLLPDNNGQYETASVTAKLTVTPVPATVVTYDPWVPSAATRRYGDAPFKLNPPTSTPVHTGSISYSAAPAGVVTIAADGTVTVLKAGTVTITATQAAVDAPAPGLAQGTVTGELKVLPAQATITGFADITRTLDADSIKNIFNLQATAVIPAGLPDALPIISYSISDGGVATIAANQVTLLKAGTATITAKVDPARNGDRFESVVYEAKLTVNAPTAVQYDPWAIPNIKFKPNATFELSATPPKATPVHGGTIKYRTDTPDVVDVTELGKVTLRKVGKAIVVAEQAALGTLASGTVTASFDVLPGTPELSWGEPLKLMLGSGEQTIAPPKSSNEDASATFSYSIDDSSFATLQVDRLTPVKVGKTTIRATQAAAGNYEGASISKELEVVPMVIALSLGNIDRTLDADPAKNVVTLSATAAVPAGVTPTITYSSSDPSIASVNGNTLTLHKAGSTFISASLEGMPGLYDAASVDARLTVRAPSVGATINDITATFGSPPVDLPTVTTIAGGTPNTGPRTFTIDDGRIAFVENGKIVIQGAGETMIRLAIPETNGVAAVSATAKLTVQKASPGLTMAAMQRTTGQGPFTPITQSASDGARLFSLVSGAGTVANIVDNQVVPLAAGTARVRVQQEAASNYLGESAEADLTVSTTAPSLTIDVEPRFVGDATFIPRVVTNSAGTKRFSSSNKAVAEVNETTGEVTLVGAGDSDIAVTVGATPVFSEATASAKLTVSKLSAQLAVGGATRTLTMGKFPLNISSRSTGEVFSVTVDNSAIASVEGSGLSWNITPLSAGTTVVTVKQRADDKHLEASATATLTFTAPLAASMQWAPRTQWVLNAADNSFDLPKAVSNNTAGEIRYESSNPGVATVDGSTMKVTVLSVGTTTLRAVQQAAAGFSQTTVESTLTVVQQAANQAMQQGEVSTAAIQKRYGDPDFTVESKPSILSGIDPLTWTITGYTSTAQDILSVNGNLVTILKPGNATIQAIWRNPANGAQVQVNHPFQILKALPRTVLNFAVPLELPFQQDARVTPSITTASTAPIKLLSENSAIAAADGDSLVLKQPASVLIRVTQAENEYYEAFSTEFRLDLKLATPVLTEFPDRSLTLDARQPNVDLISPKSPSTGGFTYESSDKAVAEVFGNVLSLKAPGLVVITAKQEAKGAYGAAQISARYLVQGADAGLAFESGPDTLTLGQPYLAIAKSAHTVKPVKYRSTSAIATVDAQTGLITPLSVGVVDIVAEQEAGGVYALAQVTKTFKIVPAAALSLADLSARVGDAPFVPPWKTDSDGKITVQVTPEVGANVVGFDSATNQITPTGEGSVRLKLQQEGTSLFGPATTIARLTVKPRLPVITGLATSYTKAFPATQSFDLPKPESTNKDAALQFGIGNPAVASVTPKADGSATVTLLAVGTTTITVSQPGGNGWDAVSVSVPLNVTAGTTQPVPFKSQLEVPYGSPDFKLPAQLDGVPDAITGYTSSDPGIAKVADDGFTVSVVEVGSTTIKAMRNGVEVATGVLNVVKAMQTLDFADRTVSLPTDPRALPAVTLNATASSGGPVSFSITGGDRNAAMLGSDKRTLWLLWDSLWDRDSGGRDAEVTIKAEVGGDAHYLPASVTRTFKIRRASDVAPPWYELRQGLPFTTLPAIIPNGQATYQVILRHNMSPNRRFIASVAADERMKCRVADIQLGGSPEVDTVITMVFEGGLGICRLNVSTDDNDLSAALLLASVEGLRLIDPPSDVVWPALRLEYGLPVPSHFYSVQLCAEYRNKYPDAPLDSHYSPAGNTYCPPNDVPFGVPVAPFQFDLSTDVKALTPGIVALSADAIMGVPGRISGTEWKDPANNPPPAGGANGVVLSAEWMHNNPPRAIGVGVGTTELTGYVDGKLARTTVTVVKGTPRVSGWDTVITLTKGVLSGEAIVPPLSSSPAPMSYSVSPPGLARIENGRVIPVMEGEGHLIMSQASTSNYNAISVSRPLFVSPPPPPVVFDSVTRVYGDQDFTMQVPLDALGGQPFTATSSSPSVVEVSADADKGVLNIAIRGAGSSTIDVVQAGVSKAQATVNILKALPRLEFVAEGDIKLVQGHCPIGEPITRYTTVHFPKLNDGLFSSPVNGEQTVMNASLKSLSNGAVTYRSSDSVMLSFPAGSNTGSLTKATNLETMGSRTGRPFDLVITQAATANYEAQTITLPGAVLVFSSPDIYVHIRREEFPNGMPNCPP